MLPALPNRLGWLLAYFESLGCLYPVIFSLLHCLPASEHIEALTFHWKRLLFYQEHGKDLGCGIEDILVFLSREPHWFELKIVMFEPQPCCNALRHEMLVFSWELGEELFGWEIGHCDVMRASQQARSVADAYAEQKETPRVRIGQLWHLLECLLDEETISARSAY